MKTEKLLLLGIILWAIFTITAVGTAGYIALHFITKFW